MNYQSLMKPLLAAGALVIVLAALGVPVGYLAFPLLIVACPLMMFFMMRGMTTAAGPTADRMTTPPAPTGTFECLPHRGVLPHPDSGSLRAPDAWRNRQTA